jgi:alkyl sulfatase BDS1-like metallo-beta-lactamase superfamily hydrolase
VARYLTQEWLDATRALAADQPHRPGVSIRLNWVVSGGPDKEVSYYWVLVNGKLEEAQLGSLDDAEVTLLMSYDDSVLQAKGELDANAAFMQGRIKASGNMAKLMSLLPLTNSPEYKELGEKIRDLTEF